MKVSRGLYFKIESESISLNQMDLFAKQLIRLIDPLAKIKLASSESGNMVYSVYPSNSDAANKIIHDYNYKYFEDDYHTLVMWKFAKPRYEVIIENLPENLSRRDCFLIMEKFGPIGRVSPCKSKKSVAWISFVYKESALSAANSEIFFRGEKLNVSITHDNIERFKKTRKEL